jgi:hypothetical protein
MDNWRIWVHGAISAFVGGAANMVTVIVIDPITFNLGAQWRKTLAASLVGGVLALANFLKTPPPNVAVVRTTTEKVTETLNDNVSK